MERSLILVADDEAAIRNVMVAMLEARGYSAVPAPDAASALELFRSRQPAFKLLVTDIDMPDMNGIELSQTVLAEVPDARILLVSGKPLPQATRFPLLMKPFTAAELCQAVTSALA
ncbi:MAG TPA: response regulator [Bryobacteraceae bacterium]|nr:response regulator [Bryobacteraceae bacterium]